MLDFKQIQELIKLVNKTNTSEVKIEQGDFKILIRGEKFSKPKIGQAPIMAAPLQQAPPIVSAPPTQAAQVVEKNDAKETKAPASTEEQQSSNLIEVKSPMIGTFYRSSSPETPPFVKVGDTIEEGSVLCIVEAMKLFNEIESEVTGTIVKVLVENANPVEYDTPLFLVDPS